MIQVNDPLLTPKLRVTHIDRKRLNHHLSGWNAVCSMLASDLLTETDMRKLILIEASTEKRTAIIEKLTGAYLTKLRRRTIKELTT